MVPLGAAMGGVLGEKRDGKVLTRERERESERRVRVFV